MIDKESELIHLILVVVAALDSLSTVVHNEGDEAEPEEKKHDQAPKLALNIAHPVIAIVTREQRN